MPVPPRFHSLRVADVRRETADAVSIAFTVPPALAPDFRFAPGQYLTLRRHVAGQELRRSYSICSGPDDGELRIAVKRVDGGAFSEWANRGIAAGDMLEVMSPTGRFGIAAQPEAARVFAAFAAGSGITPILSIMRALLLDEPQSAFFLFYGNRSTADILFRTAIDALKDRFPGRLAVFHVLSREQQDLPALNGRLDAARLRALLTHVVPASRLDHVFVCGPAAMSDELVPALAALGIGENRIHVERFVSALGGVPRPRPAPAPDAAPFAVAELMVDGRRAEVPVAAGETVLDAALRAGLDLPYACKGGMCSTCRARVLSGTVEMAVNFSLEPWEVAAGYALTCQARPTSSRVTVDYDHV